MPKTFKDLHEGIPYHKVQGEEFGCYQLHRPSKCGLKFPISNQFIHKCEVPKKEFVKVPDLEKGFRNLLVPSSKPNLYPAVMHKKEFERLKQQARKVTREETIAAIHAQEATIQKEAAESEARKNQLKANLKMQPRDPYTAGGVDPELEGPDQTAHTLTRAEMLRVDNMQGPRMCNRVILASKCHAIRDAQVLEKELIKKEMDEEQRRLDAIMEESRQAAVKRAEREEARRHELRLQNLSALKEQIQAHRTANIMEAERIEEECIRMNQANIAMQIDEAHKVKEKHERQLRLKEILDQGNAQILYYKKLQSEEDRISDLRVADFLRQKQEREAKNKAVADKVKAAKQKGIDHIAKDQKEEQMLKEELERIRNLKIQEDVEREYRRKERAAAIKRNRDLRDLHESRAQQIKDIHRTIAREIAMDERCFNNAARQNEEFLQKEKELEEQHKASVERHRQEIMKQINDKERARAELREKIHNQGVAIRLELDQQDKYERTVIKQKLGAMRKQKVSEKYVKEVEQMLEQHGFL